jgi:hypothetical protein
MSPIFGGNVAINRTLNEMYPNARRVASRFLNRAVRDLVAESLPDNSGVQISLKVNDDTQLGSLALVRNTSPDLGTAKVISSYDDASLSIGSELTYTDSDPAIAGQRVFYWARALSADGSAEAHFGPAIAGLSPDAAPKNDPPADWSVWKSAAAANVVTIGVEIRPETGTQPDVIRVYASGYLGVSDFVAVADGANWPFKFTMIATGETVTLKLVAIYGTTQSAFTSALTVTLNAAATVPARILIADAEELTTGVQIGWSGGVEADLTTFQIWRAARGAGFGAASNIGSASVSGNQRYTFLDASGLTAAFEWYVVAVNAAGSSAASDALVPGQIISSANLPPNVPSNNTNTATVDSIDDGAGHATVRVYGAGGVGSSWTRPTGYGTETYPAHTFTGKSFTTTYFVTVNRASGNWTITTSYPDTLPDGEVWAGAVTTIDSGGTGGTSGGGGGVGGVGGIRGPQN